MKKNINEQNVRVGETVNLYNKIDERPENFLVQAKISQFLPDMPSEGKTIQLKRKRNVFFPGSIMKVFKLEVPGKSDAKLFFNCPYYQDSASFQYVADNNQQEVFNSALSGILTRQFCSEKKQLSTGIIPKREKVTVPKASYSSTKVGGSPMAEGKEIIRLTESDLVRLVKRILSETK